MSQVLLTRPSLVVWQLTLNSGPDNRLRPDLLAELSAQLDVIEAEWRTSGGGQRNNLGKHKGAGAVVITSAFPKFFSNGLDPAVFGTVPNFFEGELGKQRQERCSRGVELEHPLLQLGLLVLWERICSPPC